MGRDVCVGGCKLVKVAHMLSMYMYVCMHARIHVACRPLEFYSRRRLTVQLQEGDAGE